MRGARYVYTVQGARTQSRGSRGKGKGGGETRGHVQQADASSAALGTFPVRAARSVHVRLEQYICTPGSPQVGDTFGGDCN